MASIRKRGKYWQARVIRKGYPDQVKSFHSKSEAEVWARQIENEIDRRVFVSRAEAERRTLFDILERYKQEISPSKRGRSFEVIRIAALQREPISQLKMASLTSRELATYRDMRLKQVSGSTVNRELNILGSVINHARREWGIHIENC